MKEDRFPNILCTESLTLLESICLEVIFQSQFPLRPRPKGRLPPHTHREMQTNIQMSFLSHFLCRSNRVSLGLSGKLLDPAGTHPEYEPGYRILVAKFPFFSWWALKWGSLVFLKVLPIAVFLLLTAIVLIHPKVFLKKVDGSQFQVGGPYPWNVTSSG